MDFILGEGNSNLNFHFLPEKFTNMGTQYTTRFKIATCGGYVFEDKLIFS